MLRPLPPSINLGYANWGECDDKIATAAANGVNLIVWFALSMVIDSAGAPSIAGGPNLTCVANVATSLDTQGLPTHHFISIGGWDAPHPSTQFSGDAWWAALKNYDEGAATAGLVGGFDGIDWDLEGNDDLSSPYNRFGPDELRLIARVSELAKADGKYVSMVPAQSYLNSGTSEFAFNVNLSATCWHPEFLYAGRNVYAALLALAPQDTFDLISLQLYESWSVADCMLSPASQGGHGMPLSLYFDQLIQQMATGWTVGFELEPSLGLLNQTIVVPSTKLLLGMANGWTGRGGCETEPCKALYIAPDTLEDAWPQMKFQPRGLFFWDISDEGDSTGASGTPLYLAKVFNNVLHTRPTPQVAL